MKILLQNLETLEYSSDETHWTSDLEAAVDFVKVPRALDYAMRQGPGDVRVVMKFPDSRYDIKLPPVHLTGLKCH
jgi:hypothetical protein